ncbi:tRNA (adenosine(37)-N6)-threonylcarbamoyltransferase complex dimerization subunit type 1 TsaB [Gemella cuniculi]|uniref:tRNA (adenosine(37)-N6)-threonylcarbamoyltransferase complex dimerization subunit type 1 TsaB n=1 Tax=Gemella cuniculi TaxID=150240 RepID=UPI0004887D2F|nr:tRNA (adenosine(37)-N6)-threonylcarbamoyltransferase complex dimerization subunit type 1 TsaB [Gemella cuniculi]
MVSLVVEASNGFLSLACLDDNQVISERNIECSNNLSEVILQEIVLCLNEAGKKKSDLKEIISSSGPGSYTAIRVVAAVCKTLAYTLKINLKIISSLKFQALLEYESENLIVPLIDARRGYVFSAVYKKNKNDFVEILKEGYYSLEEVNKFLLDSGENVVYVGKDVSKLKEKLLVGEQFSYNKNDIRAKNVLKVYDSLKIVDSYNMKPQYLRKTEAERGLKND